MSDNKDEWTISFKQLGIIIAAFSIGLIFALLMSNAQETTTSNFTTTELIGFVLSVILSGASIVLAIAAISLGKLSEKSVIERSDESIRLQNEVFVKTTEALLRIESSTGVTEKRIEDIISGRVGDISHQVAEVASRHNRQSPQATKELEETIRKSLLSEVRDESPEQKKARILRRQERKEKEEIEEGKYQKLHDDLLLGIGNSDSIKISKVGHGNMGDDGANFDGLYEKDTNKFAALTFRPNIDIDTIVSFAPLLVRDIVDLKLSDAFIVLFNNENNNKIDLDELKNSLSYIREDVFNKIHFVESEMNDDNILIAVEEIISKL
jgi:hypothetical protein